MPPLASTVTIDGLKVGCRLKNNPSSISQPSKQIGGPNCNPTQTPQHPWQPPSHEVRDPDRRPQMQSR